jgi:hypothetical protein
MQSWCPNRMWLTLRASGTCGSTSRSNAPVCFPQRLARPWNRSTGTKPDRTPKTDGRRSAASRSRTVPPANFAPALPPAGADSASEREIVKLATTRLTEALSIRLLAAAKELPLPPT